MMNYREIDTRKTLSEMRKNANICGSSFSKNCSKSCKNFDKCLKVEEMNKSIKQ